MTGSRLNELRRCTVCGCTLGHAPHHTDITKCRDCSRPPPDQSPMERTRVLYAQGYSHAQIAKALGVQVATVRDRLRRARAQGIATQRGAR